MMLTVNLKNLQLVEWSIVKLGQYDMKIVLKKDSDCSEERQTLLNSYLNKNNQNITFLSFFCLKYKFGVFVLVNTPVAV